MAATPITPAGKQEAENMTRLEDFSGGIWEVTKWLIGFVGVAAPFTFLLDKDSPLAAFSWVLGAAGAVIVGGFLRFFLWSVTGSRLHDPDKVAARPHKLIYALLIIAWILQIVALIAAPGLGLVGVVSAVTSRTPDARAKVDSQLAMRLSWYAAKPGRPPDAVQAYCKAHLGDDAVSNAFLDACARFMQKPAPNLGEAQALLKEVQRAP